LKDINFLKDCDKLYYEQGKSILSDHEYDKLKEELQNKYPNDIYWNEIGYQDSHKYGTEIKHSIVCGSLNKSTNFDDLLKWLELNFKDKILPKMLLQYKIDGLTCCLRYENGKLKYAATRGNGFIGKDVTNNIKYVKNVPLEIKELNTVEVRGEIFKNRQDFFANWIGKNYSNPRNFAAGSLNQKDAKITKERGLEFIAYEEVFLNHLTELGKCNFLVHNNFYTIANLVLQFSDINELTNYIKQYMDSINRNNLPFDIDGLVLKINDINVAKKMGYANEGRIPKSSRAIKFPTEQVPAIIKDIIFDTGRTGVIIPIAIVEPVSLCNTIIKKVTLHNISIMKELQLSVGSKVLLEKSGDIIPHIIKKLSDPNEINIIKIPQSCPICNGNVEMVNDKNLYCTNESCPSLLYKSIDHFFKSLNVKGIGIEFSKKIVNEFNLNSIDEIFSISKEELQNKFSTRRGELLYNTINQIKEITITDLIKSLSIGGIGSMSKDLTTIINTLEDIDNLTTNDICKLEGFSTIKANKFLTDWKNKKDIVFNILKHIKLIKEDIIETTNKLNGLSFCFTGSFKNPTRKEMEQLVKTNGGKLASVTKKLTYLVWDNNITKGKYQKAIELSIPIISQQDFLKLIN